MKRPLMNTSRGHDVSPKSSGVRCEADTAPLGARIGTNVDSAIGDGLVKCQSSFRVVGNPAAWNAAIACSRMGANHAGPSGRAVLNCSTNAVLTLGSRPLLGCHPVVAALLQLQRQFLATGPGDAAVDQHVHLVGDDVVEQSLVVGDHQE